MTNRQKRMVLLCAVLGAVGSAMTGCSEETAGPDGGAPDGGTTDSAVPPPPPADAGLGAFGANCTANNQCTSTFCCLPGQQCGGGGGGGGDSGTDGGDGGDGGDAGGGTGTGGGNNFCSEHCTTDNQCPTRSTGAAGKCNPTGGGGQGVCLK